MHTAVVSKRTYSKQTSGRTEMVRPDAFMGKCFSISHLNRKNCGRP